MINAHTTARINAVNGLNEVHNTLVSIRAYVCLSEKDVERIDNMVLDADAIINRLMGVVK